MSKKKNKKYANPVWSVLIFMGIVLLFIAFALRQPDNDQGDYGISAMLPEDKHEVFVMVNFTNAEHEFRCLSTHFELLLNRSRFKTHFAFPEDREVNFRENDILPNKSD